MTVPPDEARAMWLCETCGYMATGPTCSRWRCGGSAKRVDEARRLLETELDWEGHRVSLGIMGLGASEAQTQAIIAFTDYRQKVYHLERERDAALARAEKLIADVDDLINERDVLSSRLREAETARDNLRPFVVQAHRDRSRLREAEGIMEQLLARAVPSSRRQTDAAKHARRFLSASPTPTEESE